MMESAVTMGLVLGRGGRVGSVGSSVDEEAVVALVIVDVVETGLPGCGASTPPQLPLIIALCISRQAPPIVGYF